MIPDLISLIDTFPVAMTADYVAILQPEPVEVDRTKTGKLLLWTQDKFGQFKQDDKGNPVPLMDETTGEQKFIIIPKHDTDSVVPDEGYVLAVGPGRRTIDGDRIPPEIQTGDMVLYDKYAGSLYKYGEHIYRVVREQDVRGYNSLWRKVMYDARTVVIASALATESEPAHLLAPVPATALDPMLLRLVDPQ